MTHFGFPGADGPSLNDGASDDVKQSGVHADGGRVFATRAIGNGTYFSDARILAVDDERSNLMLLEAMLTRFGYDNVVLTTDSAKVPQLCADLSPDLILLDLHMPRPDGFALLEELSELIRGGPCTPIVPVIIISADLSDETRQRALEMGANDFIAKPFKPVETSLRVRNLLEIRRLSREVTAHNRLLEEQLQRAQSARAGV